MIIAFIVMLVYNMLSCKIRTDCDPRSVCLSVEIGLTLTIPIISAGSFGLSCDYKANLSRLLPPARKISNFFVHFWNFTRHGLKMHWGRAYVYKKADQTEDCFWYINALEAPSVQFAMSISREMLRSKKELKQAIQSENRHSNVFILCGTPDDITTIKNETTIPPEIVFILIDIYNHGYHTNMTANPSMDNVLVLTLPERQYNNTVVYNSTELNDYVAGYHDGVLLFGHVLRQRLTNELRGRATQPTTTELPDVNPFRNVSFQGMGGYYVLDENGDRDVNFSVIYTSTIDKQYKTLFVFDTSINETRVEDSTPSLPWPGSQLPGDKPINPNDLKTEDIIVIVLSASVVVVTAIALIFYRQNMKERQNQKRWSHISPDLIGPLDGKELSLVSLKIDEDNRKDSCYQIHRARYDKKPVILKELQHTDGNFSEIQRIELNTLLRIDYYNLTKFYGTVKFEYGLFGVFEFCERGSLRYVLNDTISYPEKTFMDLEFKISVMYDIAKGMSYLHSSNIEVHGRLKSSNCVVDNRMVVKITDFGCNTILNPCKDLWTAPEHLRKQGISQKGDVYSFAIIAQEIILRKNPFFTQACSDIAEKLYMVQYPSQTGFFRPDLNFETAAENEAELYMLIKNCWEEDPERRPDFKKIEGSLGKIFSNLHNQANESYMDNLIRRLQMYSRNLEHLVEERTSLYKAERDRADRLNFLLLPAYVMHPCSTLTLNPNSNTSFMSTSWLNSNPIYHPNLNPNLSFMSTSWLNPNPIYHPNLNPNLSFMSTSWFNPNPIYHPNLNPNLSFMSTSWVNPNPIYHPNLNPNLSFMSTSWFKPNPIYHPNLNPNLSFMSTSWFNPNPIYHPNLNPNLSFMSTSWFNPNPIYHPNLNPNLSFMSTSWFNPNPIYHPNLNPNLSFMSTSWFNPNPIYHPNLNPNLSFMSTSWFNPNPIYHPNLNPNLSFMSTSWLNSNPIYHPNLNPNLSFMSTSWLNSNPIYHPNLNPNLSFMSTSWFNPNPIYHPNLNPNLSFMSTSWFNPNPIYHPNLNPNLSFMSTSWFNPNPIYHPNLNPNLSFMSISWFKPNNPNPLNA
uniref:guanylate cyclase n=1 Tax=Oncorhynchus mykiss TaxID=8022 RepID=A0A8K9XVE3_ONCMY